MTRLHWDWESRSTVDLNTCGSAVYAAHPSTQPMCAAYRFDTGPVKLWLPNEPLPPEVREHVKRGGTVVAHNAGFELDIWNMMHARHPDEWPALLPEQVICTMAKALALGLPGALGKLGAILGINAEKDSEGQRVMLRLCKPQTHRSTGLQYWVDDPELYKILYAYCIRDVEAETEVDLKLPDLSPAEQEMWAIDYRINRRGIGLDAPSILAARSLVETEVKSIKLAIGKLTNGRATATQRDKLLAWIKEQGLDLEDLGKRSVQRALEQKELSPELREVLKLRQEGAKSSTAKLTKMLKGVSADGRARGLYQYHGAATGRWSGKRIQLQNLPRTPDWFKPKDAENVIDWLRYSCARDAIRFDYAREEKQSDGTVQRVPGSVMNCVSFSLRSMLKAAPGARYLCADYSNIEGRVLAWLAGEDWKLQAFRDYDTITGTDAKGKSVRLGADLYKVSYSKSFGTPIDEIADSQRQVGKGQELGLGFGGGHGAFVSLSQIYGIDLEAIVDIVRASAEPWQFKKASEAYSKPGANHHELSRDVWEALFVIIRAWRKANACIVEFWYALEDAMGKAVTDPGNAYGVNDKIFYVVKNGWLWCRLPSGRLLAYSNPLAYIVKTPWGEERIRVEVKGVDNGFFRAYPLWGGLAAENVTQATARDVQAEAIKRLERAGYPVVLHTHDEVAAELPYGMGTKAEYEALMATLPRWATGLPVSVAGWEGERYRKE